MDKKNNKNRTIKRHFTCIRSLIDNFDVVVVMVVVDKSVWAGFRTSVVVVFYRYSNGK